MTVILTIGPQESPCKLPYEIPREADRVIRDIKTILDNNGTCSLEIQDDPMDNPDYAIFARLPLLVENPLNAILTISEAAVIWQLDSSTIRHAIRQGRLHIGTDCRRSDGGPWLIARAAMRRVFGERP